MSTINTVLVGKRRTGKSTFIKVLGNIDHVKEPVPVFCDTAMCTTNTLVLVPYDERTTLRFSILEVTAVNTRNQADANREDITTTLHTIKSTLSAANINMSILAFVLNVNNVGEEDFELFRYFQKKLGERFSPQSLLLLTNCESKSTDELIQYERELVNSSVFAEFVAFCQLGHAFTGSM